MKVFLSWSGQRSHKIASALREWLPSVLQAVNPWLSSSDIKAGMRWANELQLQLEESRVGIICLTPENLSAPWLLYEAGALSKALGDAYVCPYLFGFSPSELTGPLIQFQSASANKDGTFHLISTLNRALGSNSLNESTLRDTFEMWWPKLEEQFSIISSDAVSESSKSSTNEITKDLIEAAGKTPPDEVIDLLQQVIKQLSTPSKEEKKEERPLKERVFIVHGHNNEIKEMVARFVEKLGAAAIILHEQPNEGRTIIEKFESHASVDYAVVLLTGDDAGGPKHLSETNELALRARQNVIFELGFFTAKLGRERIAVLYEEGVEVPSDYSGIIYIPIDSQGIWKFSLGKEFKTAGLHIDINNIL